MKGMLLLKQRSRPTTSNTMAFLHAPSPLLYIRKWEGPSDMLAKQMRIGQTED